jgi:hypothetical protein
VQPEKDRDPEKKGFAVLIAVERAEDLEGKPLDLDRAGGDRAGGDRGGAAGGA